MKTFLLWRFEPDASDAVPFAHASAQLQHVFSPLFRTQPRLIVRACGDSIGFAALELPVPNWKRPFLEEERESWAFAIEYPLNLDSVLRRAGTFGPLPLIRLSRLLEDDPKPRLCDLAPPFCMVWSSRNSSQIFAQNDAMGQAQLYEYRDHRIWAVSNRIVAFQALGIPIRPSREEWAARASLGWFPLDMTGFCGIRHVAPGTQFQVGRHGVSASTVDALSSWLAPTEQLPEGDWLEMARQSLKNLLQDAAPYWETPDAGLTGGWDSRACVSSLRAIGADFRARVKGHPDSPDAKAAQELARIAGVDLVLETEAELPGENAEDCRRSILLSLLWQAGHADTEKHKTMFAKGRQLKEMKINLMGQHGELGRGSLYAESMRTMRAMGMAVSGFHIAKALPDAVLARAPVLIRKDLREYVRETVQRAIGRAETYDLSGLHRLDYFYLMECTRRRSGGSLNGQTGLVIAPFLNPDFIRACFARCSLDKGKSVFHKYIVARNTPDWADYPYVKKRASANPAMLYYDLHAYWKTTGAPVVHEAIEAGGFWMDVFDASQTRKLPFAAADDLTMMYLLPELLSSPSACVAAETS